MRTGKSQHCGDRRHDPIAADTKVTKTMRSERIQGAPADHATGSLLVRCFRRWTAALASRDDVPPERCRRHLLRVALISGFCGLLLGAQSGLQIPVESAQVLAGLVKYPADNPFYLYHLKTWTLLHQVSALLLACGIGERVVSMLLGGLLGVMSFQALSFCVFALSRNWLLAVLLPILCLWAEMCQEIQGVYEVFLLSDRPWMYYGAFGTALVLLAWSLYGLGMRRASAWLMGLAPACHPALGSWCLGIGVVSFLWNRKQERPFLKPVATWLGIGLLLSAASFAYHLHQIRELPSISPEVRSQYVAAFAAGWDSHRQAYPLGGVGLYYGVCAGAVALVWLRRLSHDAASCGRFLMGTLAISAALGVSLALSTHWREHLPTQVVMAMPGRYINVIAQVFPALVLGLVARYRWHPTIYALQGGLMAYVALRVFRNDTHLYVPEVRHVLLMAAATTMGCAWQLARNGSEPSRALRLLRHLAALILLGLAFWPAPHDWHVSATYLLGVAAIYLPAPVQRLLDRDPIRSLVTAVTAVGGGCAAMEVLGWQPTVGLCLALLAAWVVRWALRGGQARSLLRPLRFAAAGGACCLAVATLGSATFADLAKGYKAIHVWQSDPLLARVHEGSGLVVIAPGVRGMQLRTGRPVLLGPLNQLPYVPESAPAMNNILQRLHNDDLLKPRPSDYVPEPGGIVRSASRDLWQARSPAAWRALAEEFGFTQVVVRPDWQLQLSLVAQSNLWALYAVPDETSSPEPQPGPVAEGIEGSPGVFR